MSFGHFFMQDDNGNELPNNVNQDAMMRSPAGMGMGGAFGSTAAGNALFASMGVSETSAPNSSFLGASSAAGMNNLLQSLPPQSQQPFMQQPSNLVDDNSLLAAMQQHHQQQQQQQPLLQGFNGTGGGMSQPPQDGTAQQALQNMIGGSSLQQLTMPSLNSAGNSAVLNSMSNSLYNPMNSSATQPNLGQVNMAGLGNDTYSSMMSQMDTGTNNSALMLQQQQQQLQLERQQNLFLQQQIHQQQQMQQLQMQQLQQQQIQRQQLQPLTNELKNSASFPQNSAAPTPTFMSGKIESIAATVEPSRPAVIRASENELSKLQTRVAGASSKKRAKTFPEKLMHAMLEHGEEDAVGWLPDGKSFVIVSPDKFVEQVLNKVFKQAKYASFIRKLHRWGFMRLTSGTGTDCFHHPLFQKNRRDLASKITSATSKDGPKKGLASYVSSRGNSDKPPSLAGVEKFIRAKALSKGDDDGDAIGSGSEREGVEFMMKGSSMAGSEAV